MTTTNNTEIELHHQLMTVYKCIAAFKDIYENIPEDDRYASVLSVIGDRLDLEFNKLMPMALTAQASTNGNAALQEVKTS